MSLGIGLSPYIAPSDCSGNGLCFCTRWCSIPCYMFIFEKFVTNTLGDIRTYGGSWIYSENRSVAYFDLLDLHVVLFIRRRIGSIQNTNGSVQFLATDLASLLLRLELYKSRWYELRSKIDRVESWWRHPPQHSEFVIRKSLDGWTSVNDWSKAKKQVAEIIFRRSTTDWDVTVLKQWIPSSSAITSNWTSWMYQPTTWKRFLTDVSKTPEMITVVIVYLH